MPAEQPRPLDLPGEAERLGRRVVDDALQLFGRALWPEIARRLEVKYGPPWETAVELGRIRGSPHWYEPTDPYYLSWLVLDRWRDLIDRRDHRSGDVRRAVESLRDARNSLAHPSEGRAKFVTPEVGLRTVEAVARVLGFFGCLKGAVKSHLDGYRRDAEGLVARIGTPSIVDRRRAWTTRILEDPEIDLSWLPHSSRRAEKAEALFLEPGLVPCGGTTPPSSGASTIESLLTRHPRRVLVTAPLGGGKSTLLRHICRRIAAEPERFGGRTPLLRSASALAQRLAADASLRFEDVLRAQQERDRELIAYELEADRLLLLIDGLDEISDPKARAHFRRALEAFTTDYPTTPIAVTTREGSTGQGALLPSFKKYELAPLSRSQQCELMMRVVAALGGSSGEDPALEQLFTALDDRWYGSDLSSSPLLLTLIAAVWVADRSVPQRRPALMERILDLLLQTWPGRRGVDGVEDPATGERWRRALEGLASAALSADGSFAHQAAKRMLATWFIAEDSAGQQVALQQAHSFLNTMRRDVGLLVAINDGPAAELRYEFRHRSIAEYLAACELVRRSDRDPAEVLPLLHVGRWAQVVEDYFAVLSESRQSQLAVVLRLVLEQEDSTEDHLLLNLRLLLRLVERGVIHPAAAEGHALFTKAASAFLDCGHDLWAPELLGGLLALAREYPDEAFRWVASFPPGPRTDVLIIVAGRPDDAIRRRVLQGVNDGLYGAAAQAVERVTLDELARSRPQTELALSEADLTYVSRGWDGDLYGLGLKGDTAARLVGLGVPVLSGKQLIADPQAALVAMPFVLNMGDLGDLNGDIVVRKLAADPALEPILRATAWRWWGPLLRYLVTAGDAAPGELIDLVRDLDDDSSFVEEYFELLLKGPRGLRAHAADMLSINLGPLVIAEAGVDENELPLGLRPHPGRATQLFRSAWRDAGPYERLLLVTQTLSGVDSTLPRDWVWEQIQYVLPDPDPAVDAAARRLLAWRGGEPPFAELRDWEDDPGATRWRVPPGAVTAVLLREALDAPSRSELEARLEAAVGPARDRPPLVLRPAVWPASPAAEEVGRSWAASNEGLRRLWGLYLLGRLAREADASAILGPGLRGDRDTSRLAAAAIQPPDCADVGWLIEAITDHALSGGDEGTWVRLSQSLNDGLVDEAQRRRLGRAVVDVLDVDPSFGARELAEGLLTGRDVRTSAETSALETL